MSNRIIPSFTVVLEDEAYIHEPPDELMNLLVTIMGQNAIDVSTERVFGCGVDCLNGYIFWTFSNETDAQRFLDRDREVRKGVEDVTRGIARGRR